MIEPDIKPGEDAPMQGEIPHLSADNKRTQCPHCLIWYPMPISKYHDMAECQRRQGVPSPEIRRIVFCFQCGNALEYVAGDVGVGAWWSHVNHPADDHEAEPNVNLTIPVYTSNPPLLEDVDDDEEQEERSAPLTTEERRVTEETLQEEALQALRDKLDGSLKPEHPGGRTNLEQQAYEQGRADMEEELRGHGGAGRAKDWLFLVVRDMPVEFRDLTQAENYAEVKVKDAEGMASASVLLVPSDWRDYTKVATNLGVVMAAHTDAEEIVQKFFPDDEEF